MRGPNLNDEEWLTIVSVLFECRVKGRPKRGRMKELAAQFQVNKQTITNLWKKAKKQHEEGIPINVKSLIPGKFGKAPMICPVEKIASIELPKRSTILKLSNEIGCHPSAVQRWVKRGEIRSHSSAIHPVLSEQNKFSRLHFVISKLYSDKTLKCLKFKDMSNTIHIDEKWFNMTKATQRHYLVPEEETPYRSCKSKRFIVKVMFLTAVSRPIYEENGDILFDGKIGIFPLTFTSPAKRNSRNRRAGTMETKPIESINKVVIKDFLINKVIPAIKMKWPESANKNIIIQQDNATPHIHGNDPDFIRAATSDGFSIQLQQQPSNSPDLNVLDLGFFRSIQSLQSSKTAKTVDELVANVTEAFENQKAQCLDDVWLSLQACMVEIMKRRGHNDYKLPHLKKVAARQAGTLQRDLVVSEDLVADCMAYLIAVAKDCDLEEIKANLRIQLLDV
ncbi:hypothetical protein RND81_07G072700 [Saponaria officinalis]|uniref:DUF7769 domain-containing protein n=1 Tax=Saponaria officinalis TaxID=3572 RepID=A0AAW1JMU1_SAPOF